MYWTNERSNFSSYVPLNLKFKISYTYSYIFHLEHSHKNIHREEADTEIIKTVMKMRTPKRNPVICRNSQWLAPHQVVEPHDLTPRSHPNHV